MDKNLSIRREMELQIAGKLPVERQHPKEGESRWYYIDPCGRERNFSLLTEAKTIDVPTQDTPNPILQDIMREEADKNPENYYIWHTVGDDKVRSSHEERDGQIFAWDAAPEGGHPGEDYNCRGTAEPYEPGKEYIALKTISNIYNYNPNAEKFTEQEILGMLNDKRFHKALREYLISNEGGYNNDKYDRGKETKYGISKRTFPNEDIKNLTRERANMLFYRHYWKWNGISKLPDDIVGFVFDSGTNIKPERAIKFVHASLGITPGTIIGNTTLNRLDEVNHENFLNNYKDTVRQYYHEVVRKFPDQRRYLNGWLNRVESYHLSK